MDESSCAKLLHGVLVGYLEVHFVVFHFHQVSDWQGGVTELVVGLVDDDDSPRLLVQMLLHPADVFESLANNFVPYATLLQLNDHMTMFRVLAKEIDSTCFSRVIFLSDER